MRSVCLVLFVAGFASAHPPAQATAPPPNVTYRDLEVPRPPVTVRRFVPIEEQVEQPPARYREYTESRTYTVPLDAPRYSASYAAPAAAPCAPAAHSARLYVAAPPVYAAAPAPKYSARLYVAAPAAVYAAPVAVVTPPRQYATPIRDFIFGR